MRYRVWQVFTRMGVLESPANQAEHEINRLHEEYGWIPISITEVSGNVPDFVVLFDTNPDN